MKQFLLLMLLIPVLACIKTKETNQEEPASEITCDENGCEGTYIGPEFINGSDIAHQFSNKMSAAVGDQLKELYRTNTFSNEDLKNIVMTTAGMGTGQVTFYLSIPFIKVPSKCEAYTSFDHCGGWNHTPSIEKRKKELSKALLDGDTLDISELKSTKEGLQEYWIQWRNKDLQSDCL